MIVATRRHLEREIWKDVAIVALALLLTALFAQFCRGQASSEREPARLPVEVSLAARPMPTEAAREDRYMQETMRSGEPVDPAPPLADEAPKQIWQVLKLHRDRKPERAVEAWKLIVLTADKEVWRQVALAQAWLELGKLDEAEEALARATDADSNNAVAWYLTGLVRLRRAALAREWYDAEGPVQFRLVSTAEPKVSPNSRGMYELAAAAAFHRAIDTAELVDFDLPLVMQSTQASMASPTVSDLLIAIRAERFQSRSHVLLGDLCLKRGLREAAEKEFDAARKLGEPVATEYRALARSYREEGDRSAAFRAHLKSATQSPSLLRPLVEAYRDLESD